MLSAFSSDFDSLFCPPLSNSQQEKLLCTIRPKVITPPPMDRSVRRDSQPPPFQFRVSFFWRFFTLFVPQVLLFWTFFGFAQRFMSSVVDISSLLFLLPLVEFLSHIFILLKTSFQIKPQPHLKALKPRFPRMLTPSSPTKSRTFTCVTHCRPYDVVGNGVPGYDLAFRLGVECCPPPFLPPPPTYPP